MPPIDDEPAQESPPPPPHAPDPEAKSLFISTAPVFDRHSGAVWSLTAAEAAEGGGALEPLAPNDPRLAVWGLAPLVRS